MTVSVEPAVIPDKTPTLLIVALVFVTDHVPPVILSAKVMVEPGHTDPEPVIVPAVAGMVMTVTGCRAKEVPQRLVIE
jgi:hypothetical protein